MKVYSNGYKFYGLIEARNKTPKLVDDIIPEIRSGSEKE